MKRILFVLLSFLWALTTAGANGGSATITVIYTGNADGYLESCDCPGNPYGGLARRISILGELKTTYPGAVFVDAGDFCPPHRDELLAQYSAALMKLSAYDLSVPGDQELHYSTAFLKECGVTSLNTSNIRWRDASDTSLFSTATAFKMVGGIRIALLSILSADTLSSLPKERTVGIEILDPVAFLKRSVPEARKSADIVILVSHCGTEVNRSIARQIPGIDVIVAGHLPLYLPQPLVVNDTLIVQPGEKGQRVGILELTMKEKKIIAHGNRSILLGKTIKNNPAAQELIDKYRKELKKKAIQLLE